MHGKILRRMRSKPVFYTLPIPGPTVNQDWGEIRVSRQSTKQGRGGKGGGWEHLRTRLLKARVRTGAAATKVVGARGLRKAHKCETHEAL